MTKQEMREQLAAKCNVTLEEAGTALEVGDWNMLTATHLLEEEKFRRMREVEEVASDCATMEAMAEDGETATDEKTATARDAKRAEPGKRRRHHGVRSLGEHLHRLLAFGNRNRLEVRRDGAMVLDLPVTALAALMLFAFWVCVPLIVIGLFAGCRYSFAGQDLGRADINDALSKASEAAARAKQAAAKA